MTKSNPSSSSSSSSPPQPTNLNPSSKSSPGLSRLPIISSIVNRIVSKSTLSIQSISAHNPNESGINIKASLRVNGTGPLKAKLKFPKGAQLYVSSKELQAVDPLSVSVSKVELHSNQDSKVKSSSTNNDLVLVGYADVKPSKLKPSARGGSILNLEISLKDSSSNSDSSTSGHSILAPMVRALLIKPTSSSLKVTLKSDHAEVKAYGFRFGSLKLDKEVSIQGLGRLGGRLRFKGLDHLNVKEEDSTGKKMKLGIKLGGGGKKSQTNQKIDQSTSSEDDSLQVQDLKLISGSPETGISISANISLDNKSQISLEVGDLRFEIKVKSIVEGSKEEFPLGHLVLPNAILKPGSNSIQATGNLILPSLPQNEKTIEMEAYKTGQSVLGGLLENRALNLIAKAYTVDSASTYTSSPFPWLAKALEGSEILATLPPLGERTRILHGAELKLGEGLDSSSTSSTSLNSPLSTPDPTKTKDSFSPGEAIARATLRNGFGIDIRLHSLRARAVAISNTNPKPNEEEEEELQLGLIQTSKDWEGLLLKGNPINPLQSEGTSASLPFQLNPDPSILVEMLRRAASEKEVGLGERLEEVLEMMPVKNNNRTSSSINRKSSFKNPRNSTSGNSRPSEDDPSMDLPFLITQALSSLRITAYITATASIGQYNVPGEIHFIQESLPIVISGQTAHSLIPHVGAPLVNALVEQGNVRIQSIKVLKMSEKEIEAMATIQVDGFGPLIADVGFDNGLEIWLKEQNGDFKLVGMFKVDGTVKAIPGNRDSQELAVSFNPVPGPQSTQLFATLVSALLLEDKLSLSLRSKQCSILAGGVKFLAPISKNVTIKSVGGFKNLQVGGFEVLGEGRGPKVGESLENAMNASIGTENESQASAFKIQLQVPLHNSGDLELSLERLELGIEFNGFKIGAVGAENVELIPNKTCTVITKGLIYLPNLEEAGIDQNKIQKTRESIGMLVSGLLAGEPLEVVVRGERAWAKGSISTTPIAANRKSSVHSKETSNDSHFSTYSTSSIGTPPLSSPTVSSPFGGVPSAPSIRENTNFSIAQNERSRSLSRTKTTSNKVRIPWLDEALRNFSTKATLKMDPLAVIDRLEVGSLDVTLTTQSRPGEATPAPLVQVNDLIASYGIPYPVSVKVTHCSAAVDLLFDGEKVGQATTEEEDVEVLNSNVASPNQNGTKVNNNTGGDLKLSLKNFHLSPSSDEVLARMIAHVGDCEETSRISVNGKAIVKAMTALGELKLMVSLAPSTSSGSIPGCIIRMQGIRSMRTSPIQYDSLQVVDADSKRLKIQMNLYLNNPSKTVRLRLIDSSLSFGAYYQGNYVGRAIFGKGNFDLNKGPCKFGNVTFEYEPEHEKGVRQIPANLLTGKVTTLEIRGDDKSTPIVTLRPALHSIKLSFDLQPMLYSTLIDSIAVTLGMSVLSSYSVEADCVLNNPLAVFILLKGLSFTANYRGNPFGTASIQFPEDKPFSIRPGTPKVPGKDTAPPITVKLAQTLDKVVKAFLKEKGTIYLDVQAEANIELASSRDPTQAGFRMPVISYTQRIPLHINGLGGVSKLLWALPG